MRGQVAGDAQRGHGPTAGTAPWYHLSCKLAAWRGYTPSGLPSRSTSRAAPGVLSTSTCACACAAACCACCAASALPAPGSRRSSALRQRSRSLLRLRLRRRLSRLRLLLRLRLRRRWRWRSRSRLRLRSRPLRRPSSRPAECRAAGTAAGAGGGAAVSALLPAGAEAAPAGMNVTRTAGTTSCEGLASAPWKPTNASALLLRAGGRGGERLLGRKHTTRPASCSLSPRSPQPPPPPHPSHTHTHTLFPLPTTFVVEGAAHPPLQNAQLALQAAQRAPEAVVGGHQAAPRLGKLQRLLRAPPAVAWRQRAPRCATVRCSASIASRVCRATLCHAVHPWAPAAHLFLRMSQEMHSVAERETPAPQCTSTPAGVEHEAGAGGGGYCSKECAGTFMKTP